MNQLLAYGIYSNPGQWFEHCAVIAVCLFLFATTSFCSSDNGDQILTFIDRNEEPPEFKADSTYQYIDKQVSFGPRNPGSEGHVRARRFLEQKLEEYAGSDSVYLQPFTHTGYEGDTYKMNNIIASFRPEMDDRIMLMAHWDTRPRAERESDDRLRQEPIPGADDGASGVGVLLELARLFSNRPPPIGVDIIFFDGEDFGHEGDLENYFLGSRYWSENPPVPGYHPRFGILLDMVGAANAVFPKEGFSVQYARHVVEQVWPLAQEMGYEQYFPDKNGSSIADDHWIINRNTDIPTINIIHHKPPDSRKGGSTFPGHWHTHDDNMDIISTETLQAVGDILVELVYNRIH